jgi:ribosomal protein S18 acetylase RimI-like enzyme
LISVRRAGPADAGAIGAVHVAVWRSTYPGILPDDFLANLSVQRQIVYYREAIVRGGIATFVAVASGTDVPRGHPPRIVGFATARRSRIPGMANLADGEIETLYVLDDFRERGLGRSLMRACAGSLIQLGCHSAFLWVLRDNPSRWFYRRLGGRPIAESTIRVGGRLVAQTAYRWDPIEMLMQASPQAS